jgi:DnaJ-domain-containing protein 1
VTSCPECGEALWTPLGCEACGVLAQWEEAPGAFEVFGLAPAWEVDRKALRRALLQLQRLTHPDHAGATDQAERANAALNHAHEVLSDAFLRADDLIRRLGGPEESAERQMPQEFLMEVLEWNETLDDAAEAAPGSAEREALGPLAEQLRAQRSRRPWTPPPPAERRALPEPRPRAHPRAAPGRGQRGRRPAPAALTLHGDPAPPRSPARPAPPSPGAPPEPDPPAPWATSNWMS